MPQVLIAFDAWLPNGKKLNKGEVCTLTDQELAAIQPKPGQEAPSPSAELPKSPPSGFISQNRLGSPKFTYCSAEHYQRNKRVEVPLRPLLSSRIVAGDEAEQLRQSLTPESARTGHHRQQVRKMLAESGREVAIKHLQSLPKRERDKVLRFLDEFRDVNFEEIDQND